MTHSYPIWNIVTDDVYKSGKSYGARDWTRTEVRVGTNAKNSEILCSHYVKRDPCYGGEWMRFEFGVEDAAGNTLATVRKWMHVKSRQWQDVDPGRYIPGALTSLDFSSNRAREEARRLLRQAGVGHRSDT